MTDCSQCQGLCCVVLAFDRSEDFAFDKAPGVPCRYLARNFECRIHHQLEERGFAGCARYDCHGAGPRACAEVGADWREDPDVLGALYDVLARRPGAE